eukprot:TRINITY_DN12133_c0_g1_i1.p3 TRINITY_DN12133_c0_g1~~TRINITY_DN12133_c0_g1_i1.p3  ORF type:complete len:128 (+),score=19.23 TRINITY_DN12133_c0_g1_i1:557-940(+)
MGDAASLVLPSEHGSTEPSLNAPRRALNLLGSELGHQRLLPGLADVLERYEGAAGGGIEVEDHEEDEEDEEDEEYDMDDDNDDDQGPAVAHSGDASLTFATAEDDVSSACSDDSAPVRLRRGEFSRI